MTPSGRNVHRNTDGWLPGGWAGGEGEQLLNGHKVSFWGAGDILELTLNVPNATELFTLNG